MLDDEETPPADNTAANRRNFIIGLVIGAIPLAVGYYAVGAALNAPGLYGFYDGLGPLELAGFLYALEWLVTLAIVFTPETRRAGQGMIMSLLASPIIYYVSCAVLAQIPRG
jgi:hypothetical protein